MAVTIPVATGSARRTSHRTFDFRPSPSNPVVRLDLEQVFVLGLMPRPVLLACRVTASQPLTLRCRTRRGLPGYARRPGVVENESDEPVSRGGRSMETWISFVRSIDLTVNGATGEQPRPPSHATWGAIGGAQGDARLMACAPSARQGCRPADVCLSRQPKELSTRTFRSIWLPGGRRRLSEYRDLANGHGAFTTVSQGGLH